MKTEALTLNSAEAYYNVGNAYNKLGQNEKAIEAYQKAIEFKADKHEAYYNMGLTYQKLGQKEKALWCYLKSQQLGGSVYNLACWYAVEGRCGGCGKHWIIKKSASHTSPKMQIGMV